MEVILAAVVPVAVMAVIGYLMARWGKPVQGEMLRFLVAQVGSPALIFSALLKITFSGAMLFNYTLASIAAIACFGLIAYPVLRIARQSIRAFLPSLMFGNTGNLGLPLALYACGPMGLGYAAVIHTMTAVCNFTLGQAIASGTADWRTLMRNPALLAAFAGLAATSLHWVPPTWLHNTMDLVAGMTVPLMLLMLGTSLASIQVTTLRRALALSLFRIGLGITVGFTLAALFGLTGIPRAVFVLQSSMPVAVYNYLFATVSKTDPQGVASLVVVSTLISVATIPVLLAVLL